MSLELANHDVRWLSTPQSVRQSAEHIYQEIRRGHSEHFRLDEGQLFRAVDLTRAVTEAAYPDLEHIPYHSRLAHFGAGGVDRLSDFERRCAGLTPDEQLRSWFELIITSVLLDAGAGSSWQFVEPETGQRFARSEGLAVASYHWFVSGQMAEASTEAPAASTPALVASTQPPAAVCKTLRGITPEDVAHAFQVDAGNPLAGLDGRAELLRRLGDVVEHSDLFRGAVARPGNLADALRSSACKRADGVLELPAVRVLDAVLSGLGGVWPGREVLDGVNLGDVWTHSRFGRVPFHKLSQWLTYSLCDALERFGWNVTALDELTGLAEYRNGGLFVDLGVLVPRDPNALRVVHAVDSDLVIEWRASTLALLDRLADALREVWALDRRRLPLAKVLQGGTWAAGRQIAAQLRTDASPPIRIQSDGTVF